MRILLAPDKFRGSLTAQAVAQAMEEGVRLADASAEVALVPLADGGEGTAEILTKATDGSWHTVMVNDPIGRSIEAGFGISADGKTAFIEMALASGLQLLEATERNPLLTSTYGTGQLIRHALAIGVEHIVLGIGGSATTDAGIGMAAALGWRFLAENGFELPPNGASLSKIRQILPPASPAQQPFSASVACDVTAPLFGPSGAAYVYGPQKGATPEMVEELDSGLQQFAHVINEQFGVDVATIPGSGAAGGLGAGALFFLNAALRPGVDVVLEAVCFDQRAAHADLILTGEGKLDQQTLQGKLLKGVTDRSAAAGVPVVALCGTLELTPEEIDSLGLTAAFSVLNRPERLNEAVLTAYSDVRQATFNVCRLFLSYLSADKK
ncbi:glycerate kinase [Spirosoma fluminis]